METHSKYAQRVERHLFVFALIIFPDGLPTNHAYDGFAATNVPRRYLFQDGSHRLKQ